jgi:hypothetical protein
VDRSADVPTVVALVALSLPAFGSASVLPTVAVFDSVEPSGWLAPT